MAQRRTFEFDPSEEFPHLPAAPIVEAVIHLIARAETPWQRDDLNKRLTERLPEYPDCQLMHELQLETQFEIEASSASTKQIRRDSWLGFRLTSSDKVQIAQFNRNGFIFSRLKPYENWTNFEAEALRLWAIFVNLANPSQVQRLGVRFINRIAIAKIKDLPRKLNRPPKCLETIGMPMNGFLFQSTHGLPGQALGVNVVQTVQPSAPPQSEGPGLILDIDVFTTESFEYKEELLREYLPKMRWLKNKAFFSLVKKGTIEAFGELKQ